MTNQYEIGEEIFDHAIVLGRFGGEGKSGFGVVYLVAEKNTGLALAVKTLQKENISITDFDEFKNEILQWINLSYHPHIVKAFSIDLDDNKRPYLLMEPVFPDEYGRQNLADFMDDNLSEEQILMWSIQFCYAMDYVNQQGVIHGDIKPDNILISKGIVKITDFGLAKSLADPSKKYEGTIAYLAPESWEGIKSISSEIYAFGIVLYQMVNSGNLPFNGWNDLQWEDFHKKCEIPKLNSDLYQFIKKCLEKNPKDRYISFNELNRDLINLLNEKFNKTIDKPELEDIGNLENLNRGHLAATLKDTENCKKYYDMAIENSSNRFFVYNYALDLISLYEYQNALTQLQNLVENPDSIPLDRIYFNIGKCYHEGICLYKSIEYYKKAIEINNNDFKAHVNLGNVYKDYGFFEEALIHYEHVLNLDPTFPQALLNIVELFDKMDDEEKFREYSEKLNYIQQTPETNYYSGLFLKDSNLLKFLTSMDNAIGEYTYQIPALVQLFEFHLENGNISEADGKFDEILGLTDNMELMTSLCFSYSKYGHNKEAIKKIDLIYKKFNCKKEILFNKSFILAEFDLNKAIKLCEELLKEDITNELKSKVYVNLGNFYSERDYEKFFDYNLKAFNQNPKNITPLKNLSTYYATKGGFFFAENYVDLGLEINKNDYDLLFIKAKLCKDQFKYEEAIKYCNKCLKIKPTSEVYMFAAACFGLLKHPDESLFYLNLATNICNEFEFFKLYNLYFSLLFAFGHIDNEYD